MARERITEADVLESEKQILAQQLYDPKLVPVVATFMRPGDWLDINHADLQRVLVEWHKDGVDPNSNSYWVQVAQIAAGMDLPYWDMVTVSEVGAIMFTFTFEHHLGLVVMDAKRRRLHRMLLEGAAYLEKHRRDGGQKLLRNLTREGQALFATGVTRGRQLGLTQQDLDEISSSYWLNETRGVDVPYDNLNKTLGPIMAGEVWGLSGYSGNGKTQFAVNLARRWGKAGQPVIVFSTEMGRRWHLRTAAIEAGLKQYEVEKRRLDPDGIRSLSCALEDMKLWPVVVNTTANLRPEAVIELASEARRAWSGKHVVVVVDHVHRLDYGRSDPNREVGTATKAIKNMAVGDLDGGMSVLLLAQPRKPEETGHLYAPVRGHQVRGDYAFFNEVDIHSSVFRVWVEADSFGRTVVTPEGAPKLAKPGSDKAKLCDDRAFVLTDKRRTGGESAKPDILRYDNGTGEIF